MDTPQPPALETMCGRWHDVEWRQDPPVISNFHGSVASDRNILSVNSIVDVCTNYNTTLTDRHTHFTDTLTHFLTDRIHKYTCTHGTHTTTYMQNQVSVIA